ncbi:unnamed protein product [Discosporangium mesarthrocarpum]
MGKGQSLPLPPPPPPPTLPQQHFLTVDGIVGGPGALQAREIPGSGPYIIPVTRDGQPGEGGGAGDHDVHTSALARGAGAGAGEGREEVASQQQVSFSVTLPGRYIRDVRYGTDALPRPRAADFPPAPTGAGASSPAAGPVCAPEPGSRVGGDPGRGETAGGRGLKFAGQETTIARSKDSYDPEEYDPDAYDPSEVPVRSTPCGQASLAPEGVWIVLGGLQAVGWRAAAAAAAGIGWRQGGRSSIEAPV